MALWRLAVPSKNGTGKSCRLGAPLEALREGGIEVTSVSDVTRHPEMMDGRVKTLHPAIHAGLLARRTNPEDLAALNEQGYGPIDLVAVNLLPFS